MYTSVMDKTKGLKAKFSVLRPHLDERSRRMWAATEARALGYGGVSTVSLAIGISRRAILSALAEIESGDTLSPRRIRKQGGGRKRVEAHKSGLSELLDALIEPLTRGDPELELYNRTKKQKIVVTVIYLQTLTEEAPVEATTL
jgi:hypothetical protein